MAKKKSAIPVQQSATAPVAPPVYPTAQRIEEFGANLAGNGRTILYIIGGIIAAAILGGILYTWNARANAEASTALGKAIEIGEAQISASPVPGSTTPTYATEKERSEKAVAAFEDVAKKYGSPQREKAQYFIAVNRLKIDREAGIKELEGLSNNSNREIAALSKFALAEARAADGKYDEAAALYTQLSQGGNPIFAADTLQFSLASVYEKQGKKTEAADIYFNLAKTARETKDADGKPVTLSLTAREAARKLEKLDAARFEQLPPEPSALEL